MRDAGGELCWGLSLKLCCNPRHVLKTQDEPIEQTLIEKLGDLKYTYRPDIRDRATLEANFRQHFEALHRVHLTDTESARLLESIVTPDVFATAKHHGTHEQFHSEFKTDLDLERLPSGKFNINDLVMSLAGLAYNVLRLMGQLALLSEDAPVRHSAHIRRCVW